MPALHLDGYYPTCVTPRHTAITITITITSHSNALIFAFIVHSNQLFYLILATLLPCHSSADALKRCIIAISHLRSAASAPLSFHGCYFAAQPSAFRHFSTTAIIPVFHHPIVSSAYINLPSLPPQIGIHPTMPVFLLCSLCNNKGHNKNKCKKGKEIGQRLTKSIWNDKLALVPYLEEIIIDSQIDLVVSSDALGLLLCGRVHVNGVDSSVDEVYRATIILSDLEPKNGAPCHLKYSTIGKWACLGNSNAKYVFIK